MAKDEVESVSSAKGTDSVWKIDPPSCDNELKTVDCDQSGVSPTLKKRLFYPQRKTYCSQISIFVDDPYTSWKRYDGCRFRFRNYLSGVDLKEERHVTVLNLCVVEKSRAYFKRKANRIPVAYFKRGDVFSTTRSSGEWDVAYFHWRRHNENVHLYHNLFSNHRFYLSFVWLCWQ